MLEVIKIDLILALIIQWYKLKYFRQMQNLGMLCVYTKYLGGFSGGETIASGR